MPGGQSVRRHSLTLMACGRQATRGGAAPKSPVPYWFHVLNRIDIVRGRSDRFARAGSAPRG